MLVSIFLFPYVICVIFFVTYPTSVIKEKLYSRIGKVRLGKLLCKFRLR